MVKSDANILIPLHKNENSNQIVLDELPIFYYQHVADFSHRSPDENNNNNEEMERNGDPIPELSFESPRKLLKTRSGRTVNQPQRLTYS